MYGFKTFYYFNDFVVDVDNNIPKTKVDTLKVVMICVELVNNLVKLFLPEPTECVEEVIEEI